MLITVRVPPECTAEIEQLLTVTVIPSRQDLKAVFEVIASARAEYCSGETDEVDSDFSTSRFCFAVLSQRLIVIDLVARPSRSNVIFIVAWRTRTADAVLVAEILVIGLGTFITGGEIAFVDGIDADRLNILGPDLGVWYFRPLVLSSEFGQALAMA